jgi:hypothetical protein
MGMKKKIDNWPSPLGSVDCPPPAKLATWVENPESAEAKAHLSGCESCAAAVKSIREAASESGGNLEAFMHDVRQRGQLESEQHSSRVRIFLN